MDFSYSEMHIEIKNLAHKMLTELATVEHLKAQEQQGPYLDEKIWQQCIDAGLHCAALPEEYGGLGMDFHAVTLVCEALGQSVAMVPFIPCIASTTLPLLSHRMDAVVDQLIRDVGAGKTLVTAALIEPGNEEPSSPSTSAAKVDGQWQLTGSKHCVPYAAQSSRVLLFAKAGGQLWAGLVETSSTGVALKPQLITTGEPQYLLELDSAPAHCVAEGAAARSLLQVVNAMTMVACCAMSVGVADKMMRLTGKYTTERIQFGVPVATFQAAAHRLADTYIDVECLKINTQKAASDVAEGVYDSDAIHMAKVWCGDVMHRTSHAAQHLHGGMGIDRDYHLFRYCLWAKQLEMMLGHSRRHLEILGDTLAQRYLGTS